MYFNKIDLILCNNIKKASQKWMIITFVLMYPNYAIIKRIIKYWNPVVLKRSSKNIQNSQKSRHLMSLIMWLKLVPYNIKGKYLLDIPYNKKIKE